MPKEPKGQDKKVEADQEVLSASEQPAVSELPEEAKERTKQEFEKLKAHNKQLAEEVEKLKTQPQPVLESLSPGLPQPQMDTAEVPNLSQKQVDDITKGLIDENGFLDQALLENTLRKADWEVRQAKAEAAKAGQIAKQAMDQVNKYGQDREVRIAHKKFPNVDPDSDTFDPVFYKKVKNELLGAMYEGRKLEFADACAEVAATYQPTGKAKDVKAEAINEYKENVAKKSAMNVTGKSRPEVTSSREDLIEGTRRGDATSIAARLENI